MSRNASLIYSSPWIYQAVMRLLYGRHFQSRYTALAAEIEPGAQVLDVCAGDCYLYLNYLKAKGVDYTALDASPEMVAAAVQRGVKARIFDLWTGEVRPANVVVLQASLYQFYEHAETVLLKLQRSARQRLIVAEPVRNLSDSPLGWLAQLSHSLTVPDAANEQYSGQRFNEESLAYLFTSIPGFERSYPIPGGREVIGIFRGTAEQ